MSAAGLFTLGRVLPRLRHVVGSQHHAVLDWLRASLPDERYLRVSAQRGRQVWRSFVDEQRSLVREIGTVESALGSVRAPTIVISGAWDLVVPPSVSASIAASIPGSELVSVARTGHFVPRDAPEVVAAAVRSVEARARDLSAHHRRSTTPRRERPRGGRLPAMAIDFTFDPDVEEARVRMRAFVDDDVRPTEERLGV